MFNFFRCGGNCDCCCRFCQHDCCRSNCRPSCGCNEVNQGCGCQARPCGGCECNQGCGNRGGCEYNQGCGNQSGCGCNQGCGNQGGCGCRQNCCCRQCCCQRPCPRPCPPPCPRPCPPVPPFPPCPPVPPIPPIPPLPPVPPFPPVLTSPINVLVGGGGTATGLTTSATGAASNTQYIGFGSAAVGGAFISPVALPPATAALAFTVPAGGRLTSFTANYLPAAAPTGLTNGTVYAALMADFSGNGSFALVPGSTVAVATGINAATAAGTPYSATKALSAPIAAGTRLIVAYYLADTGATAAGTLLGYASASYTIDPRMR